MISIRALQFPIIIHWVFPIVLIHLIVESSRHAHPRLIPPLHNPVVGLSNQMS